MGGSRITLIDNECVDQRYSSTRLTCLIFCIFFRLLQMVFTSSTSCTQVISRKLNVNIRKLTIETEDGIFEELLAIKRELDGRE